MGNKISEYGDSHLYVTVDKSSFVWAVDSKGSSQASGVGWNELIKGEPFRRAKQLRLAGAPFTAYVLMEAYKLKLKGKLSSLLVCSPATPVGPITAGDPRLALLRLRSVNSPASLGGWHEATTLDSVVYKLLLQRSIAPSNYRAAICCLRGCCLYPHVSFVKDIDEEQLAWVLTDIIDPRWWVDKERPDSRSGLYRLFGLDKLFPDGTLGREAQEARKARLMLAWGSDKPASDEPGAILRRWRDITSTEIAATLFLDYLVAGWLDRVSLTHQGHLFSATDFFHDERLAKAHQEHMAAGITHREPR